MALIGDPDPAGSHDSKGEAIKIEQGAMTADRCLGRSWRCTKP
jgi:hypothetical protein